jgi:hypothetical protein
LPFPPSVPLAGDDATEDLLACFQESSEVNRAARKTSTVPRHREINEFLAR